MTTRSDAERADPVTVSRLPLMKRSELDSGHRVDRGIVYDRTGGVPVARLAPEPSTPPREAGTAALDVLDVMGLCACWTAPPGRRCKAARPESGG